MTMITHDPRTMLPGVLRGSLREFKQMPGADLLGRIEAFYTWQNERRRENLWPYSRSTCTVAPRPICTVADDAGAAAACAGSTSARRTI